MVQPTDGFHCNVTLQERSVEKPNFDFQLIPETENSTELKDCLSNPRHFLNWEYRGTESFSRFMISRFKNAYAK